MKNELVRDEQIHPVANDIFAAHGLDSFEALWNYRGEAVEAGNTGRGGWSCVEKITCSHQGVAHTFYVKKQQNYTVRSWQFLFKKIPTLLKEQTVIKRFHALQIPTLETAYFGWRIAGNEQQAMLVTWELKDFYPLDSCLKQWRTFSLDKKQAIIKAIASVLKRMHAHRVMHNCLYPKHIFVKWENEKAQVALIDLEKTKSVPCRAIACRRDLDSLNRRAVGVGIKTRLLLIRHYSSEHHFSAKTRRLIRYLASRTPQRGSHV